MRSLHALAASAALVICAAHADTIGTAPNAAGGEIHITDNSSGFCTSLGKDYMVSYATTNDVNVLLKGCWRFVDDNVHVIWADGTERMFPVARFTRTPYAVRTYGTPKDSGSSM